MLKSLTVPDALAVAAAAAQRTRDERAMLDYLGVGQQPGQTRDALAGYPLLKPNAVDLGAFESNELRDALASLTVEARRELIALVWFAQSPSLSFEAALRRVRRIPDAAQLGYLMSRRLERSVPQGLEKLGYRRGP
jgi:hypothetical protein